MVLASSRLSAAVGSQTVVHGSQPRYKVRDIMGFMHRAVRFIRTNADRWKIDPDRIGVTGSSAGGHLSLVLATKGGPGIADSKDPVERASSAVQAAGVFYPPTDYLNWSAPGDDCVGVGKQEKWQPAFGEESRTAEGRQALGRHMSSIYHISANTPPISIMHGDADPIVPLFQSQRFKEVAEANGVPIELVVKKGGKHGWPNRQADESQFLKWFDTHLLKTSATVQSAPDLKIEFGKVSRKSVFASDTQSIWGGSVVKGSDGQYHMLYSRWPKHLGWAWVTDSEIAHAVADNPLGPYKHKDVALERRGKEHWDGWCTHNPTVHKFGDKYYLYYMGNTGDGEVVGSPGKHKLNWQHRNNQRIGVAVADDPAGPWTRMDKPVLDISADREAGDALMTSNPSVCQRTDGKILMVYKAVGVHYDSTDGIDWHPAKHHEISDRTVTWEDSTSEKFDHLERPQVIVENGVPVALLCAADRIDESKVRHSFNIQIPLIVTKD